MIVEVAVLGSPSLIVLENYDLCGRKAALNLNLVLYNQSSGAV